MQSVPDFLEEQFYIQVSDDTSQFHFLAQVPGLPHLQIGSPPPPLVYFYNEDPYTMIKTATNRIKVPTTTQNLLGFFTPAHF